MMFKLEKMADMNLANKKIIKYDPSFEFSFVESKEETCAHPISNYYLKASDLSLNILISLKWADWGYNFLIMLSKGLEDLDEDFKINNLISDGIQRSELFEIPEEKHVLLLDDTILNSYEEFINLLNNEYNTIIFNENSKIHMKIKINLREFIILNNFLFPTLIKFSKF